MTDQAPRTRSVLLETGGGSTLSIERVRLLIEAGPDKGHERILTDRPVILGRGETADLRLSDSTVSREHAVIQPCQGGYRILDLGSKSGTHVDGAAITEARLTDGARIRLGSTELIFRRSEANLDCPLVSTPEFEGLLTSCQAMRRLFGVIERVAPLDLPVLIHGESGTGKESLARAVHRLSDASEGPYEVVDCTLLGEGEHMRSELFGHRKGAFTGADQDRPGAFMRAHEGTLFLDEIGELPLDLQPQLLRVLEEGEVRPLGASATRRVRVRIVTATNRDLAAEVESGRFRRDLFYRISAITVTIPPLRERGSDAVLLAEHFLPENRRLSADGRELVRTHPWPGNVRELLHAMRRAGALAEGEEVSPEELDLRTEVSPDMQIEIATGAGGTVTSDAKRPLGTLAELEEQAIREALKLYGGNRNLAAEHLGIGRATLFRKLKKMGITG